MQESEGVVAPGTPLLEVGDPTALEVVVDLLTRDAVAIEPGATATLDAWGGPALKAHVQRVEPSAFTRMSALGVEEQRVRVILDLHGEPDSRLGDGYRVGSRIVVWSTDDALTVPASAVFRHGDAWAVYALVEGKALLNPIVIGERNGRIVEVREGLQEGDMLVRTPSDRLQDGCDVQVMKPAP